MCLTYAGCPTVTIATGQKEDQPASVPLQGGQGECASAAVWWPQSWVLGPILFFVYISGLPSELSSQVHLCRWHGHIPDSWRYRRWKVVTDLDRLSLWGKWWDMEFNPSKFQVVWVTKTEDIINTVYILHGQVLEVVASAKYLGVNIFDDLSTLSWNVPLDRITAITNQTLGFIKQNIKAKNPKVWEDCL